MLFWIASSNSCKVQNMSTNETSEPSSSRGSQEAKLWAHERAEAFGEAVQFWRKKLGLTAVDLANRTKEVGYPITRATIAKIESNSRNSKVDLAEVTVLAAALRIAPVDLIFPGLPDREYRATPRSSMAATGCINWFSASDDYLDSFDFAVLGGPHAPLTDNSVELRRAISDFESYVEAVRSLPEINNDRSFGEANPIYIEGAEQYKSLIMMRKNAVDFRGGEVTLPYWYSRIQEPQSHHGEG